MISFGGSEEELDLMWNWTSQWKAELEVKPRLRPAKCYTFLKHLGPRPKLELDLVQLSSPDPQDRGQKSPLEAEPPLKCARLPVPSSAQGAGNYVITAGSGPSLPVFTPKPLTAVIVNQTNILHFHKKSISPPLSAVTGAILLLQSVVIQPFAT